MTSTIPVINLRDLAESSDLALREVFIIDGVDQLAVLRLYEVMESFFSSPFDKLLEYRGEKRNGYNFWDDTLLTPIRESFQLHSSYPADDEDFAKRLNSEFPEFLQYLLDTRRISQNVINEMRINNGNFSVHTFKYGSDPEKEFRREPHPDMNYLMGFYTPGEPLEVKISGEWIGQKLTETQVIILPRIGIEHRVQNIEKAVVRYSVVTSFI